MADHRTLASGPTVPRSLPAKTRLQAMAAEAVDSVCDALGLIGIMLLVFTAATATSCASLDDERTQVRAEIEQVAEVIAAQEQRIAELVLDDSDGTPLDPPLAVELVELRRSVAADREHLHGLIADHDALGPDSVEDIIGNVGEKLAGGDLPGAVTAGVYGAGTLVAAWIAARTRRLLRRRKRRTGTLESPNEEPGDGEVVPVSDLDARIRALLGTDTTPNANS